MIKNLIFDLGGVIITLDPQEAVRRFQRLGLKDAQQRLDAYTQSSYFGSLEQGDITEEQFRQQLSADVGRQLTWEECQYAWLGYRKEVPLRNLQLLRRLRKSGYRLILLSNTNGFMQAWAESSQFSEEQLPLRSYFDSEYKSYEVKLMKPDKRLFELVLSKENIRPDDTLFVDDGPANVAIAVLLGLHTLCPKNGEDWTHKLLMLLGEDE